jgi:uncharacterized protein
MTAEPDLATTFPGPVSAYVDELALSEEVPAAAIAACLARYQETGPLLRELLTRAADEGIERDEQALQLFRTLHIVGGARDPLSFPHLLRLFKGLEDEDEVDWLLGDSVAETLPRIVAGVFDGDADALFDAIANRALDWAIRDSLLRAATFLTWVGRIDRQRMIAFLEQFGAGDLSQDEELVWASWANAIALLGLRHLEPLVSDAERRGALADDWFGREQFEARLAQAEGAPDDKSRFDEADLGYVEDVVATLRDFGSGDARG